MTRGRPNNGTRPLSHARCYDEALIRRLVADGKSQSDVARLVGCSESTVYYALYPHRRLTTEQYRRNSYRAKTVAELQSISDFHFERVEFHQGLLDEVEEELTRRRKAPKNG